MTLREEWNAARPSTRAAYNSLHNLYQQHVGTAYRDPILNLLIRRAYDLFVWQMHYQDAWTGKHDKDTILTVQTDGTLMPIDTVPTDMFGLTLLQDQYKAIPFWFAPDYRAGYRVRKSYWTGISRKRRNLP